MDARRPARPLAGDPTTYGGKRAAGRSRLRRGCSTATLARPSRRAAAPCRSRRPNCVVIFGPGSALVEHDLLWYADLPKRDSLGSSATWRSPATSGSRSGSLGRSSDSSSSTGPCWTGTSRAFFPSSTCYVDLRRAREAALARRRGTAALAARAGREAVSYPPDLPARALGRAMAARSALGISTDAPNLAWSYELITPESGILLGTDDAVEVGFELLMAAEAERVLGAEPAKRFGVSFPIRFDYLDTLGGGDLSIQCHPSEEYMRDDVRPSLHTARDLLRHGHDAPAPKSSSACARTPTSTPFAPRRAERRIPGSRSSPSATSQEHRAIQHRLYLIPAGTPHASGAGNVVLEISATPYLYTLRFYDWLRRDLDGELRPVHLVHAFANLDTARAGDSVRRELIPEPTSGPRGCGLERARARQASRPLLRRAPARLRRLRSRTTPPDGSTCSTSSPATRSRSRPRSGDVHGLSYAETIVVPAAVGALPAAASPRRCVQGRQGIRSVTSADVVGALDIGGTHVSGGRVQVASTSVERRSRITAPLPPNGGRTEVLAVISEVTRTIAGPEVGRLGVAVPGPFDYARGVSEIAHKLDGLYGVDLRSELCAAAALPDPAAIRFLNDAEAFLLGEWWAGAARRHVRAVGITLGTGLGSAFIDGGEIVRTGAGVPPDGELYRRQFRGAPVEQDDLARALCSSAYGATRDEDLDVEQIAARAVAGRPGCTSCLRRAGARPRTVSRPVVARVRPELPRGRGLDRALVDALRREPAGGADAHFGAASRVRRRATRGCSSPRCRVLGHKAVLMVDRRLDPQVEAYVRERGAAGMRPVHQLSVSEAREAELAQLEPATRETVGQRPRARGARSRGRHPDSDLPRRLHQSPPRPRLLLRRRLGARLARRRRPGLPAACERDTVRSRLGGVPPRSGAPFSRRTRRLLRGHVLGRRARRRARAGSRSTRRRRRERRGKPCSRRRAARPRARRAEARTAAARVSAARSSSGHSVDAGRARLSPLRRSGRRVVLVSLPRGARRRRQPVGLTSPGRGPARASPGARDHGRARPASRRGRALRGPTRRRPACPRSSCVSTAQFTVSSPTPSASTQPPRRRRWRHRLCGAGSILPRASSAVDR